MDGYAGTSLELLEPDREAVCASAEPLSLFPWLLVHLLAFEEPDRKFCP